MAWLENVKSFWENVAEWLAGIVAIGIVLILIHGSTALIKSCKNETQSALPIKRNKIDTAYAELVSLKSQLEEKLESAKKLKVYYQSQTDIFKNEIILIKEDAQHKYISGEKAKLKIDNRIHNIATYIKRSQNVSQFINQLENQIDILLKDERELKAAIKQTELSGDKKELEALIKNIEKVNRKYVPAIRKLVYIETSISENELEDIKDELRKKYYK